MKLILLIIAIFCFLLAAFGVATLTLNIGWLGLAFLGASMLPAPNQV